MRHSHIRFLLLIEEIQLKEKGPFFQFDQSLLKYLRDYIQCIMNILPQNNKAFTDWFSFLNSSQLIG